MHVTLAAWIEVRYSAKSIERVYSVVNYSEGPDLTVHCTPSGTRRFDPIMSKYARFLDDILPEPNLSDVLKGVSRFNFYLSRGNIRQPLKQLIEVVLHPLTQSNPDQISEEAIYMPNGDKYRHASCCRPLYNLPIAYRQGLGVCTVLRALLTS
jgi:hypothetical protein